MFRGRWPYSPATLCRPRSTSPPSTSPTPTPSDTVTNTKSPGGPSPRTSQICASAQALAAFSMTTGRPIAAARGARSGTSCQPRPGACTTTLEVRSSMPGNAMPTPWQRPAPGWSDRSCRVSRARTLTNFAGSRSVATLRIVDSSLPTRSVRTREVRVTRTSTATPQRPRESRWSSVGLRPRSASPEAPSRTRPFPIRSPTMRPSAARCIPSRRASSAREMGWCARRRFRTT